MHYPEQIRLQFPLLVRNPELAWLDNAATTQKPAQVIDAIRMLYESDNANINRGLYDIAVRATARYESVRKVVAEFIGAGERNIVYTSGTTGGVNMVARCYLQPKLKAGSEVLISAMEHHANLIPWQIACKNSGASLRVIPIDEDGVLNMGEFRNMLSANTAMVAVTHVSNTLGTVNPVEEIIELAHSVGARVLVDAAQSIAHYPIDVSEMNADFLAFSAHKMFGPTGIGVLYGKEEVLSEMEPPNYGGDMIRTVSYQDCTLADIPRRLEAGTPHVAGVFGLGEAIRFIQHLDRTAVRESLHDLTTYATEQLLGVNGVTLIGRAPSKSSILSFTAPGVHPHDMATVLGTRQIAVRAGHHCTQPLMNHFGISGTTRASISIYNTRDEIDRLVSGVRDAINFFS